MTWKNSPTEFSLEVAKSFDKKTKAIIGYGIQKLVLGSAVDTGAFRGNMRLSVDSPDMGFNSEMVDIGGSNTISKAGFILESIKDTKGHVFYLQNNAPYAYRLEMGWSPQPTSHNLFALTAQAMKNKFEHE